MLILGLASNESWLDIKWIRSSNHSCQCHFVLDRLFHLTASPFLPVYVVLACCNWSMAHSSLFGLVSGKKEAILQLFFSPLLLTLGVEIRGIRVYELPNQIGGLKRDNVYECDLIIPICVLKHVLLIDLFSFIL